MLLIRMPEAQVAQNWTVVSYALRQALPPVAGEGDDKINNILESILLGGMQVWYTSPDAEGKQIRSILFTYVLTDPLSKVKSLLCYALYSFVRMTPEDADILYEGIIKYAKGKGCVRLAAYTINENLKSIMEKYGFENYWSFVTKEL